MGKCKEQNLDYMREKKTQQNLGTKAKVLKGHVFQYRLPERSGAKKVQQEEPKRRRVHCINQQKKTSQ